MVFEFKLCYRVMVINNDDDNNVIQWDIGRKIDM